MIFSPSQLNRRAELYHQLGAMITAGVPLIQALQMAAGNSSIRPSQRIMSALTVHLKNGLTFSDSLARVPGWMPAFDKALLSAGEHSGRLEYTFKQLGTYYATRAEILREMINGLSGTFLRLLLFLAIFPLGDFFGLVVGIMNNNYIECIPYIRDKIIEFGGLFGLILIIIIALQTESLRSILEFLAQIVPFLRTAQKHLALARLSVALESLVLSGISIIRSWPMAAAGSGSPRLKRDVAKWKTPLESGHTPAELVSQSNFFPEMFKNLYHTGEVSGRLDESLNRLQNYYREEGFRALRIFIRLFNGLIFLIVAVLIAVFIIKFWVHYYENLINSV